MSPLNQKKLVKLRKELDKLDISLINIIKRRSIIVNDVLKLKDYKNQIIDKKRIKEILKQIKQKSIKKNIDPKITKRIWTNMIYAFIDFEKRNFKKKIPINLPKNL